MPVLLVRIVILRRFAARRAPALFFPCAPFSEDLKKLFLHFPEQQLQYRQNNISMHCFVGV